ncbi:MAG: outer membrane beta-barrel protein [Rickettsiales bacterium]|nr:outer membrane beta-barrel protein [Rickettsiales bacterium]
MKRFSTLAFALVILSIFSTSAQAKTSKNKKSNPIKSSNVESETLAEVASAPEVKTSKNNSNSKTQGHYVNFDVTYTQGEFNERYTRNTNPEPVNRKPSFQNQGIGGSISYKYAFNFNGIFIAPGVFFERNNTKISETGKNDRSSIDISNRYGIRTDIGYDIGRFAPYLTGGYNNIAYRTKNHTSSKTFLRDASANDWYYGAGLKIRCNDNFSFNAEYNRESFLAKTFLTNGVKYLGYYKTDLNIYKAGIAYNF